MDAIFVANFFYISDFKGSSLTSHGIYFFNICLIGNWFRIIQILTNIAYTYNFEAGVSSDLCEDVNSLIIDVENIAQGTICLRVIKYFTGTAIDI